MLRYLLVLFRYLKVTTRLGSLLCALVLAQVVFTENVFAEGLLAGKGLKENKPEEWFQIEYILFEHLEGDRHELRFEDIKYRGIEEKPYAYFYPGSVAITINQFINKTPDDNALYEGYRRLKHDKRIRVLEYRTWQQALGRDKFYPPIKIDQDLGNNKRLVGELGISRQRYVHANINVFLARFGQVPAIDLVEWALSHYLPSPEPSAYTFLDLLLPNFQVLDSERETSIMNDVAADSQMAIPFGIVHLKESRRIKDEEIHYIDHPALALLITVKEIESPFSYGDFSNQDLSQNQ